MKLKEKRLQMTSKYIYPPKENGLIVKNIIASGVILFGLGKEYVLHYRRIVLELILLGFLVEQRMLSLEKIETIFV